MLPHSRDGDTSNMRLRTVTIYDGASLHLFGCECFSTKYTTLLELFINIPETF